MPLPQVRIFLAVKTNVSVDLLHALCGLVTIFILGASDARAEQFFALQTIASQPHSKCLEANRIDPNSVLNGATLLDRCQSVTGQFWTAKPIGEEWFQLHARTFSDSRCLLINTGEVDSIPEGTPYMGDCNEKARFKIKKVDGHSGKGFQLKTLLADREVCLASDANAVNTTAYVPVSTEPCDENGADQLWTIIGGHLVDGIPDGIPTVSPMPANDLGLPVAGAGDARSCQWNDGTGDRSEYYDCTVSLAEHNDGFTVTGPGQTHKFVISAEQPNLASGSISFGEETIRLGRFLRQLNALTCWVNERSGERLCFW